MTGANAMARMPVERAVGLAGLVGTVLVFASVIATSGGEPPLDATTAQAAVFLHGLDKDWIRAVEVAGDLGVMVLLWFLVGLGLLLRRFEGEVPLRSTVAILSGLLAASYVVLDSSQEAAAHRAADLSPAELGYAYDVTTFAFTGFWLAMGSFAFATGWAMLSTNAAPRWLGWWGVASGAALGLTPFVWSSEAAWAGPYAALWLWLITTCVRMVHRPPTAIARSSASLLS